MLEASAHRLRRALTTHRATLALGFAAFVSGCTGEITGVGPSPAASDSPVSSPTGNTGGGTTTSTSTPVDVDDLVGGGSKADIAGVTGTAGQSHRLLCTVIHAAGVPTADWNGGTELPELKA